jgi:hypothetical protein
LISQCYPVYLIDSVVNVIEGDGKVLRASQGCELTVGWRVSHQAWVDGAIECGEENSTHSVA